MEPVSKKPVEEKRQPPAAVPSLMIGDRNNLGDATTKLRHAVQDTLSDDDIEDVVDANNRVVAAPKRKRKFVTLDDFEPAPTEAIVLNTATKAAEKREKESRAMRVILSSSQTSPPKFIDGVPRGEADDSEFSQGELHYTIPM